MTKRSEDQWPEADYSDVPEGFGHMTPEAQDEISQHMAKQGKIAKKQVRKQSKKPPF